eukprot:2283699-Rhodomonas_salina.2
MAKKPKDTRVPHNTAVLRIYIIFEHRDTLVPHRDNLVPDEEGGATVHLSQHQIRLRQSAEKSNPKSNFLAQLAVRLWVFALDFAPGSQSCRRSRALHPTWPGSVIEHLSTATQAQ